MIQMIALEDEEVEHSSFVFWDTKVNPSRADMDTASGGIGVEMLKARPIIVITICLFVYFDEVNELWWSYAAGNAP